jgi:diguanylate cyclase (GGDEF)-like protein/PAS domain S-box-containing protein
MLRKEDHPAGNGEISAAEPAAQHRRLIESLTDYAIIDLSLDGRIASWNAGAKLAFGYDAQEVLGRNYSLLFLADDVARGHPGAALRSSRRYGTASRSGWHVRKGGSRIWCTDTVQALLDHNGTVTGFTKIVRDTTEQYVASEHLRESEERLSLLIESVTDYAIFALDTAGNIVLWNPGAEHLYGYRQSEVVGKHFSLLYSPEAIARGVPDMEMELAAAEGQAHDEGWHVRRSGDPFYSTGQLTRLKPDGCGEARGFVKIAHDITERHQAAETIKRQAFRDELTQLPNRAFFTDSLRRAIAHSKRHPERLFAVLFIDLDRFKVINDSLGHALADRLLVYVARTLERCVRPDDVVARLGGDEFVILLSEISSVDDAVRVVTRFQTALQFPTHLEGFEVFTTVSTGIAICSSTYDTAAQILHDADTAMYEAKARGRSQHVLFDSNMRARAKALLNLQIDLQRAVVRQDFRLQYQPIISLADGRVVGFEALVRWTHPERGTISPLQFIAEAESIGLIIQIDRWVLAEACRQLHEWQVRFDDFSLTVSVNLSSKHIADENLLAEIRDVLRRNELTARSLKLEITETVLMEHIESTKSTIENLAEIGVDIYIDDFGTGYSSLSYLTRFPLNLLKIDRSFVSQISSNPRSIEIARTIVGLAHNLGLEALAEGIETEQQLITVRALGCELGQGFWFSPPVDAGAAQNFIGRLLPAWSGSLLE